MHILAGVYPRDAGSLELDERDVAFADEREAQRAGVAIVFQERSLFGPLSIAENIFAGRQPIGRFGLIDRRSQVRRSRELLARVGLDADPETPVERLTSARQQLVEIAKALSLDARLIIFDEPTAALTPRETARLFSVIRDLRARNVGVIHISHRLDEIFQIADRVTVLKDGVGQGTHLVADVTPSDLVARMVGRGIDPARRRAPGARVDVPPTLEVMDLSDAGDEPRQGPRLREISLQVERGEILALAGLVGAGRSELAHAIFGNRPGVSGEVRVNGRRVEIRSPADAIAAGMGYLTEDRKHDGLFLEMSIAENILAVSRPDNGSWLYAAAAGRIETGELCRALDVVCRGPDEQVARLSGGNQQKVALAKWLRLAPSILIVDEPTRGVDVGAKVEIHRFLFELAAKGSAVVVISSDLPEVLAVADRIVVMREGRIAGELPAGTTEDQVMALAATGSRGARDEPE
jgi:ribose transport system ATP-binding protein